MDREALSKRNTDPQPTCTGVEARKTIEDTTAEQDTLVHQPLESPNSQIRLLKPLSTSGDNDLAFALSIWDKQQAPEYNAISYTWGDPKSTRAILINDKALIARENCYYALWQAHLHHPYDYIWIDAICINQQDLEEKGYQVQRMFEMDQSAAEVLVCVGPHADQSELLANYAHDLEIIDEHISQKFNHCRSTADSHRDIWIDARGPNYVAEAEKVIHPFHSRPYWTRLWVVQEVAAARSKKVLCGGDVLSWTAIWCFNLACYRHDLTFHSIIDNATPNLSVESALTLFGKFKCLNPRDRLYGFLGIINWEKQRCPAPTIDYSISTFDLLLKVVSYLHDHDLLFEIMDIFNISTSTLRFQTLLDSGRQGPIRSPQALPSPRHFRVLSRIAPNHSIVFCEIELDSQGRMSAPFKLKEQEGSDVCALACEGAREGDLLVPYSIYRTDAFLVLRLDQDNAYSIIGQALSINKHFLSGCHSYWQYFTYPDGKGAQCSYHTAHFEINLTPEERLLLWGQDYISEDCLDPHAQLDRLRTNVALYPGAAVRVTDMQYVTGSLQSRI